MDGDDLARRRRVRRGVIRAATFVIALLTAFAFLPLRGSLWWVGAGLGAALVVTTMPFAVSRLRRVLASELPLFAAFEALVELLAMLIVGFASVYYAMNRDGDQLSELETRIDAMYFTVTTLSTVGFGDVTPITQGARSVVTAQILFDLVFVGAALRVFAKAVTR